VRFGLFAVCLRLPLVFCLLALLACLLRSRLPFAVVLCCVSSHPLPGRLPCRSLGSAAKPNRAQTRNRRSRESQKSRSCDSCQGHSGEFGNVLVLDCKASERPGAGHSTLAGGCSGKGWRSWQLLLRKQVVERLL